MGQFDGWHYYSLDLQIRPPLILGTCQLSAPSFQGDEKPTGEPLEIEKFFVWWPIKLGWKGSEPVKLCH